MADTQTAPASAAAQTQTTPAPAQDAQQKAPPEMGLASLLDVIVDEQTKGLLVAQEVERRQFSNNLNLATALANSGYFTDASDKWKALAKIEIGRSWGLSAADSMRHILMVNGKPSLENEVIAAKLRAKGWDWDPYFLNGHGANCKGVRLFIKKNGQPYLRIKRDDHGNRILDENKLPIMEQVVVEFLESDAKLIKAREGDKTVSLLEKKGPWTEGWRGNMMYWRAIAQFRRFYANDVLNGAESPDEISDYKAQSNTAPALSALRNEIATEAPKSTNSEPDWVKQKARPATISEIRSMEKMLGPEAWGAILSLHGTADVAGIKTEDAARTILHAMKDAAMKSAEGAAA